MATRYILYYITDRTQFPGDETARRRKLLDKIAEASRCGVDFIQLREKDLSSRELENLAGAAVANIRAAGDQAARPRTRLLINSRSDIALALGLDGVHLRSDDVSVADARGVAGTVLAQNTKPETRNWVVAASCHSVQDVQRAAADGADFAVFAPVFEKREVPQSVPTGLTELRRACENGIPVLALGGVTVERAKSCLDAGAAGVAGIRLFQDNEIAEVVHLVRGR